MSTLLIKNGNILIHFFGNSINIALPYHWQPALTPAGEGGSSLACPRPSGVKRYYWSANTSQPILVSQ